MKRMTLGSLIFLVAAPAIADQGFRIGGEIGISHNESVIGDYTTVQAQFVGEYLFNENFGLSAELGGLASTFDDYDADATARLYQTFATGYIPVSQSVRLYGGIGYYWLDGEEVCVQDACFELEGSDSDLAAQAGIEFGNQGTWSFAAEYEYFDGDDSDGTLGFRFAYHF